MAKDSIGIDISKDTLDVCCPGNDKVVQFSNSPADLRALRRRIGGDMPDLVAYEATGAYHAASEHSFAGVLPLMKVNPLRVRRCAQARGTRARRRLHLGEPYHCACECDEASEGGNGFVAA